MVAPIFAVVFCKFAWLPFLFLFPVSSSPFTLSTSLFSFRPPLSQPILIVLLMIASPPRPPIPLSFSFPAVRHICT